VDEQTSTVALTVTVLCCFLVLFSELSFFKPYIFATSYITNKCMTSAHFFPLQYQQQTANKLCNLMSVCAVNHVDVT